MKNTEDCANIYLVSRQDGAASTELSASGGFYVKDGAYYITYIEVEGAESTRVLIKVTDSGVTVRRMGECQTVISYIEGKKTELSYRTPYGTMDMAVKTEGIENGLSEKGGTLKLIYTLFAGGEGSEHELLLKIKLLRKE